MPSWHGCVTPPTGVGDQYEVPPCLLCLLCDACTIKLSVQWEIVHVPRDVDFGEKLNPAYPGQPHGVV